MHLQFTYSRIFVIPLFLCVTATPVAVSANSDKAVIVAKGAPPSAQPPAAGAKKTKVKSHALGVTQKKPAPLK